MSDLNSLRFELQWKSAEPSGDAAEWTRGHLTAWLGSRLIWGTMRAGQPTAVEWTWIELLEFLADSWAYLEWEQACPIDIMPVRPSRLRVVAEERWQSEPETVVEREDDLLRAFELRHNLATALQGLWLSPLWMIREGGQMRIDCGDRGEAWLSRYAVITELQRLGEMVAGRLANSHDARAVAVREQWKARSTSASERVIHIATGLPSAAVLAIAGDMDVVEAWELPAQQTAESELMAVARMTGGSLAASKDPG